MINSETQLSPAKQALLQIRELKRQLAAARQVPSTDIAIVATACRFPRTADTPEAYWQMLLEGQSQIAEIPDTRWDLEAFYDDDSQVPGKMYSRWGAFLDRIDTFDAEFFGISPREATWVDPQQRLLMETSWEALERAGWTGKSLSRKTGVFVGWMHNDYQNEASDSFLNLNPYIATGAAGSFLSGRLAYYLGLEGPSLAVDTACSSSLVALHLACLSLSSGESDAALVGGVNVIVSPTTNILTCKLQALSPQGHSLAFDARADGYVRGEGCGVVAVKRLADAERDGDPILAVIKGTAVGHNGMSNGLTVPNSQAQERVIREALRRAGCAGASVDYLEAHGTGTSLGDPIELRAAAAVFGEGREQSQPLSVGSVKTNIGHLEAAAGMAGLIKVITSLQQEKIPPHLNFEQPNPHIPWDQIPVEVLTQAKDWPADRARLAGVSAFGMSGTNAHAILAAYPQRQHASTARLNGTSHARGNGHAGNGTVEPRTRATASAEGKSAPQLLVLSGRTEDALNEQIRRAADWIERQPASEFADIAFTLGAGRTHFDHRLALVADSPTDAAAQLQAAGRSQSTADVHFGQARTAPRVCWQFTGQGSQYLNMAAALYRENALFREAVDECETWSREQRGESLLEVLFEKETQLHDTRWTQPAIFAVQKGLVALLQCADMRPDFVMGHSVGQYAAACTADVMSWAEGFFLISERGRCIGELERSGTMVAIFAPASQVDEALAEHPQVSLAARNGTHQVISGRSELVDRLASEFEQRGIRCKRLQTSHAFHSDLMDPALAPFEQQAGRVSFRQAAIPLVCNVSGAILPADFEFTAAYWASHIRQAVRYSDGVQALQENGCELLLELGPHAVLTNMARAVWQGDGGTLISCLHKGTADSSSLLNAFGRLYVHGLAPDFRGLHSERRRIVSLPTYPFQRRRFWGPPKPKAAHSATHTAHPLLGESYSLAGVSDEQRYESTIEPDSPAWLPDHAVMEDVVFPGAAFLEMAIEAGQGATLQNAQFETPLQPQGRTRLQSVFSKKQAEQSFEAYSTPADEKEHWRRHFRCQYAAPAESRPANVILKELKDAFPQAVSPEEFYETLAGIGLNYGPSFRVVESLSTSQTGVLAELQVRGDLRGYSLPPTLLDGALHCLAVGLLTNPDGDLFLPVGIGRMTVHAPLGDRVCCHAEWTQPEGDERQADLVLYDEDGKTAVEIEQLTVRRLSRSALRKMNGEQPQRLLYDIRWQEYRLPDTAVESRTWLIVQPADHHASTEQHPASQLAGILAARGHRAITILLDENSSDFSSSESTFQFDGGNSDHWKQLLTDLKSADVDAFDGAIWFASPSSNRSAVELAESHCLNVVTAINTLQQQGVRGLECGFQIVTAGGIETGVSDPPEGNAVDPSQTQFWGFGRSLAAEQPTFQVRLIDLPAGDIEPQLPLLADYALNATPENQIAIHDQRYLIPRLRRAAVDSADPAFPVANEGACLITGGLGMLGQETARWLAGQGAPHLVLISRRPPNEVAERTIAELRSAGTEVTVAAVDSTDSEAMASLLARFGNDLPPLKGVIHAAGVLDDGLIADQTAERYRNVLRPKVIGAQLLHELTADCDLNFFVLYSSAASVLGSPGQTNYATANAFLDGLAAFRRQAGLPAVSVNWGPWTVGMAADESIARRMALQGIVPLDASAHRVLAPALHQQQANSLVIDVDWRRLNAASGGMSPPLLSEVVPQRKQTAAATSEFVSRLRTMPVGDRRTSLRDSIQLEFQNILGSDDKPSTDRPVIEFGLDSLMAVEFSSRLQALVGEEYAIAPTMLFDYPTIDAITDYVLEQIGDDSPETATSSETSATEPVPADRGATPKVLDRDNIAVVGLSCRFPGANNAAEYWQNLLDGVDAVSEIPATRWDVERFYSAERRPGKMYCREGGFIEGIDEFAAEFFNLSSDEACWLDPQHRLLLENCWTALEDAGLPPNAMPDPAVGVFMGIMSSDYAFLPSLEEQELLEKFQGAGFSHSAGVGRISHYFGFEGPSIAVDTASSSSLVAVFQAMRSLQDRQCQLALAGGVNAILAPGNTLLMSNAGLLSPDGRCKSFSASADGFGRGEGCGVVVLKREQDALRDGDRILATLRGGAVAHNGTSGGVTMPNGPAQSRLIRAAWDDAGLPPKTAQYLEAHGTGTEYGDPMELTAAAAVFGRGRAKNNPLLVGSVKANISHLEAAGGISGLIKTVLAVHHGYLPRQLHFEQPSPHIPWKRLPVRMVEQACPWPDVEERIAGVTALGLSGTNAHIVLSSPAQPQYESVEDAGSAASPDPQLLQWSARSAAALRTMLTNHRDYLQQHPDLSLTDVATTLSRSRSGFGYRVALASDSIADAITQTDDLLANWPDSLETPPGQHAWAIGKAASAARQTWVIEPLTPNQLSQLRQLYQDEPVFRASVQPLFASFEEFLDAETGDRTAVRDWFEAETRAEPSEELQSVVEFCGQWGLVSLLKSATGLPESVAGCGIGQYVAGCLAGVLKPQDAVRLVYEQRRRPADDFEQFADTFDYYPPGLPLWCSLDRERIPLHRTPGGSYWKRHSEASPHVAGLLVAIREQQTGGLLRIGGANEGSDAASELQLLPDDSQNPSLDLRRRLGRLFVAGFKVDAPRLSGRPGRAVSLPTYPFERQRYWITDLITSDGSENPTSQTIAAQANTGQTNTAQTTEDERG